MENRAARDLKRAIDFYVFDLMNGLYRPRAQPVPRLREILSDHQRSHSQILRRHRPAGQSRYTCRQYGAMMHQKEQNKQHPVYRLFNTRTDTMLTEGAWL